VSYHENLTASTARLVGAQASEVVVMNTLTVNLHLMMTSFYRPSPERFVIVTGSNGFPSDRYALASQVRLHGFDPAKAIIEVRPEQGDELTVDDVIRVLDANDGKVALLLLEGVNYYTGQALDIRRLTAEAHKRNIRAGFDLAHAAGNIPLQLHDWGVDFAVWCSYKYLNGGPGCLAGCFVHERWGNQPELPRLAGWWGHDKKSRFKMGPQFVPIEGAEGWQLSNPPILPLACLRASMELFDSAGMEALRKKSVDLTGYLEFLLSRIPSEVGKIITPTNPDSRGCQLSFRMFHEGRAVFERLQAQGVMCDWREPDVIRVAPVPLYNSFEDVFDFYEVLLNCLELLQ
jgi:kynureninase